MKKNLLFLAAASLAFSASAADDGQPGVVLENFLIEQVSPSGEWGYSFDPFFGMCVVINFETGAYEIFEGDDLYEWNTSSGNAVSDNGIVLVSLNYSGTPSYIKDGEIYDLPLLDTDNSAYSSGITPDGSRIVGTVGLPMQIDAKDVMQKPVIWDLDENGEYGLYKMLPYPAQDWTGRLPQYILANCISADGKVIIGQVHDYQGMLDQPIVWREDEEGNWEYELIHPELIFPNGVDLPEDPGDSPNAPKYTDFMTPEEAEAYEEALSNWSWSSGEPYPNYEDYMTEEEIAQYNEAYESYELAYQEWDEKYWAFSEAMDEAIAGGMTYSMNATNLSCNGRFYATMNYSMEMDWDSWSWIEKGYPVVFDLESGDYYTYEVEDALVASTYINDNGILMGAAPASDYSRNVYISDEIGKPMVPFQEWIETKDPEVYNWLKENCCHDITYYDYVYDEETGESVEEEITLTDQWYIGTPTANADFTTLYSWTLNNWDEEPMAYFYSYIISLGNYSSIGSAIVDTEKTDNKVYNLQGIEMKNNALTPGLYIKNGKKFIVK